MSIIKKQIQKYLLNKPTPFHSPAHCGTQSANDLSELSGLDDLQYPNEIIKESQDFVAKLFGAQKSFYLINGASAGMQAAMLSIKNDKPVLAARNIHKSVISGLILSGLKLEWFEPEWLSDFSVYGKFHLDHLNTNYINESFSAVVVTNPSYEGFYSELPKLKIPIIVDEAHGAHYHFSDKLPKPALESGADIAVQSWHKTLGSLTQTGVLHVNKSSRINPEIIAESLRLLQSTSPSYLLLESLCETAHRMQKSGDDIFNNAIKKASLVSFAKAKNNDPLRVLFNGADGSFIDKYFEENGIALEAHSFNSALAFINYANTEEEIQKLNKVYEGLEIAIQKRQEKIKTKQKPKFGKQVLSPREAFYSDYKEINLEASEGFVSQELYAPCPPGIALLVPGQKITKENIEILRSEKEKVRIITTS